MTMKRFVIFSVAVLALDLIPLGLGVSEPSAQAASSPISLYNCTQRQVRPTNIVLTCADSNRYIKDITWSSWNSSSAKATGTLYWNGCSPACFDGKWHSTTIHFSARDPKTVLTHPIFTQLYGPSSAWGTGSKVWDLPIRPE